MEKYSLSDFNIDSNVYYDYAYIITILEKIMGKDLDEIKEEVNSLKVTLTDEKIKTYLYEKFQNDASEVKKKVLNDKCDHQDVIERFCDRLLLSKYSFDPHTLDYFSSYSDIVRKKALKLLNIIELIGINQVVDIMDSLAELDIVLDFNHNIRGEDIVRLIEPTVYNIGELNKKVDEGNNLSTYFNFKLPNYPLYRDEMLPSESIFIKDLYHGRIPGNVPISKRQEDELFDDYGKNAKAWAKTIFKFHNQ